MVHPRWPPFWAASDAPTQSSPLSRRVVSGNERSVVLSAEGVRVATLRFRHPAPDLGVDGPTRRGRDTPSIYAAAHMVAGRPRSDPRATPCSRSPGLRCLLHRDSARDSSVLCPPQTPIWSYGRFWQRITSRKRTHRGPASCPSGPRSSRGPVAQGVSLVESATASRSVQRKVTVCLCCAPVLGDGLDPGALARSNSDR